MVRAKFKLNRIERSMGMFKKPGTNVYVKGEQQTLVMNPVSPTNDPDSENSKFWDASPGGELRLNCVNAAAVAQFELDKEYYLDFTPAEPNE